MTVTARRALRGIIAGAAGIGIAVSLAACSGGTSPTSEPDPAPAVGDPHGELEQAAIRVTGITGPGLVPLQIAMDQTAEPYGLTIEFVPATDSGAATTSVISGDVQIANSSYFGVIDAINQGLPLEVLAEDWASTLDTGFLMARPGSGIESLEDLAGKTVNVISPTSSHAIKLHDTMIKQGLDPDEVNWVSLPYSQVADAFAQGTIDASSAVGPTLSTVTAAGATVVFDYAEGEYEGMAESGWVSTVDWIAANPNTAAAFQCAIFEAQGLINTDHELYIEKFQTFLGAPEAAARADVRQNYQTTNRIDALNKNVEVYQTSTLYTGGDFDFADHTAAVPSNC